MGCIDEYACVCVLSVAYIPFNPVANEREKKIESRIKSANKYKEELQLLCI